LRLWAVAGVWHRGIEARPAGRSTRRLWPERYPDAKGRIGRDPGIHAIVLRLARTSAPPHRIRTTLLPLRRRFGEEHPAATVQSELAQLALAQADRPIDPDFGHFGKRQVAGRGLAGAAAEKDARVLGVARRVHAQVAETLQDLARHVGRQRQFA